MSTRVSDTAYMESSLSKIQGFTPDIRIMTEMDTAHV